jgi:hypothetical protein
MKYLTQNTLQEMKMYQMDRDIPTWEHRFNVIDAWMTSFRMSPEIFLSVFRDIKKENGLQYKSQMLWRGFEIRILTENYLKYRSENIPIFVNGDGKCQSWSRTRQGSIEWMKMNWTTHPVDQKDITKGSSYIFLVSANIHESEILIDVQQDLLEIVDPSWFEDNGLKELAQDASRQITRTFAKENEMIVCPDHREIPTLSVEVFKITGDAML